MAKSIKAFFTGILASATFTACDMAGEVAPRPLPQAVRSPSPTPTYSTPNPTPSPSPTESLSVDAVTPRRSPVPTVTPSWSPLPSPPPFAPPPHDPPPAPIPPACGSQTTLGSVDLSITGLATSPTFKPGFGFFLSRLSPLNQSTRFFFSASDDCVDPDLLVHSQEFCSGRFPSPQGMPNNWLQFALGCDPSHADQVTCPVLSSGQVIDPARDRYQLMTDFRLTRVEPGTAETGPVIRNFYLPTLYYERSGQLTLVRFDTGEGDGVIPPIQIEARNIRLVSDDGTAVTVNGTIITMVYHAASCTLDVR